jgi:hypothetical protein
MKYNHRTPYTRSYDKFQYYLSDCECNLCLHFLGKKAGCELETCCCADIREDTELAGRKDRPKGWNKGWDKA